MNDAAFGRFYRDGEIIACQGEEGDCMFVVQDGEVDILVADGGTQILLRTAGRNEVLGEMAIFERKPRSATIRARGRARVLTLDKRNFLRRINEDPSLAYRLVETSSRRVRELSDEIVVLRKELAEHRKAPEQPLSS